MRRTGITVNRAELEQKVARMERRDRILSGAPERAAELSALRAELAEAKADLAALGGV